MSVIYNHFVFLDVISEFPFLLPKGTNTVKFDEDQDLNIVRPQKEIIKIGKYTIFTLITN